MGSQSLSAIELVKLRNETTAPKILVDEYWKEIREMSGTRNQQYLNELAIDIKLYPETIKVLHEEGRVNAKGEALPYVRAILDSARLGEALATVHY